MNMRRDIGTNPFVTQEIEKIHSEISDKSSWKRNENYFTQSVIRMREDDTHASSCPNFTPLPIEKK